MDQPLGTSLSGGPGYCCCPVNMYVLKGLPAPLRPNADEIYYNVCGFDHSTHGIGIAHIGLYRMDLTDIAHWPQEAGSAGMAAYHGDHGARRREALHHITADEARSAQDGDAPIPHDAAAIAAGDRRALYTSAAIKARAASCAGARNH